MKKLFLLILTVVLLTGCISDLPAASGLGGVDYYFPRAGADVQTQLISVIKSANKTLDIAVYSFTDQKIANAVIDDEKRGVAVRVITDKTESSNSYQKQLLQTLKDAGIPVKINKHSGLMHLKVTIVDTTECTTGSFNYTKSAEQRNDEVFVVIRSSDIRPALRANSLRCGAIRRTIRTIERAARPFPVLIFYAWSKTAWGLPRPQQNRSTTRTRH